VIDALEMASRRLDSLGRHCVTSFPASPSHEEQVATELTSSIPCYAAVSFGPIRVLMAMRFQALIVTMTMISSASLSSPKRRLASS
jgi:hypothetical protein